MKGAGRTIEDQDLARAMKASGLGTPATRAETIEKLIRTGYVERQRKQLRATDQGPGPDRAWSPTPLRSPELTAAWEQRLKEVEEGARPVADFYRGILDLVRDLIPKVWSGPAFTPAQAAAARQGASVRGGRGRAGQKAPRARKSPHAPGQRQVGPQSSKVESAIPPGPVGLPCPKCGNGLIIQGRRGFGCGRYREGCDFVVWREVAGKRLTERQIADLIRSGRTRPIQGFRDPAGQVFAARLELGPAFQTVIRRSDTPGDRD